MAHTTPILFNDYTLIAYVPKERRYPSGMAYYVDKGYMVSFLMDYTYIQLLEEFSEGAQHKISYRLSYAKTYLDRDSKRLKKVEGSLSFMKKEGPILSVPLVLSDDFVGYPSGNLLIRRAWSRYSLIENHQMEEVESQIYNTEKNSLTFRKKDKIMKEAKGYLEKTITDLQKSIESLNHNISCWENNLQIIKNKAYNPPF